MHPSCSEREAALAPGSGAQMDGLIQASRNRIIYLPLLFTDSQQSNEWWIPAFQILLIKLSVVLQRQYVWPEMITHDRFPLSDRCLSRRSPHTSIMGTKHILE